MPEQLDMSERFDKTPTKTDRQTQSHNQYRAITQRRASKNCTERCTCKMYTAMKRQSSHLIPTKLPTKQKT